MNTQLKKHLVTGGFMLIGALPGIGVFVAFKLAEAQLPLTVVETCFWLLGGFTVLVFGVMLGAVTCYLARLTESSNQRTTK